MTAPEALVRGIYLVDLPVIEYLEMPAYADLHAFAATDAVVRDDEGGFHCHQR